MTSVAVFNMGPTSAPYSWAINHGRTGSSPSEGPDPAGLLNPHSPWPSPGSQGAPSRSWDSTAPSLLYGDPGTGPGSSPGAYPETPSYHTPASQHGIQSEYQPGYQNGYQPPAGSAEAVPAPPVRWLSAPPPLPDPWQGTWQGTRQWGTGPGVVSLLPWFLGMSVVGGADSPAGRSRRPLPGSRTAPNQPSSPARPGPARPAGGPSVDPASDPGRTATENGRLHEVYRWKRVDYTFPNKAARSRSMASGDFVPDNNLPLGVETYKDRIFMSIPRWKPGVPVTLAYVPRYPNGDSSPPLRPYPDWTWHRVPRSGQNDSCTALTSVFRMTADECGRLWVLDSGAVDAIGEIKTICPPQIVIFDLNTDQLLWRYVIPPEQRKPESLFTNIVVDIRDGQCDDAYAYAADVFRYGLLVYSWREDRSYRLNHNFFFPDPIASRFVLDNVTFRWMDGVFGLGLSPIDEAGDRTLYFHPMASFREFAVRTSLLRNETLANANPDEFIMLGSRGRNQSHSSASAMDRRGVLFFNLVTQDALGCWDSAKTYSRGHVGHVAQDHQLLNFPNDLKVDKEEPQNIWVLSNRLHLYLYRSLSPNEYNYRILTGTVDRATEGTICDPSKVGPQTTVPKDIDACDSL